MLWLDYNDKKDVDVLKLTKEQIVELVEKDFINFEWEDFKLYTLKGNEDLNEIYKCVNILDKKDIKTLRQLEAFIKTKDNFKDWESDLETLEKCFILDIYNIDTEDSKRCIKKICEIYDIEEKTIKYIDENKIIDKAIKDNKLITVDGSNYILKI